MIIEQMSISVSRGKRQELGEVFSSLVGPIQVQPGCLYCRLFQTWPGRDRLQMEARWESEEALMGHLQSHIYKKLLLLMELSSAPPGLEFFTVLEFRGLDLVETARRSQD